MPNRLLRVIGVAVVVIVMLAIVAAAASPHIYILKKVDQQELGVKMKSGRIVDIVTSGVYSDIGLYATMVKVNTQAVPIDVTDPELITSDKQRIGLQVTADVFRPKYEQRDVIEQNWSQYRLLYVDDAVLSKRITSFSLQAMKVCVGNKTFDQNVIGSGRDDLRNCIDEELGNLSNAVGIDVQNVVVPQVIISPEVQASMDSIVQSRLATEKAKQDALKGKEEAAAKQAAQEGEIRVQQSVQQETLRQQTITASLEQQKLEAQRTVIEANRINAEKEKGLKDAQALVAAKQAEIDLANEIALAKLYSANPGYLNLQVILANASAIKPTDKLIITPNGVMPNLVFSNGQTVPAFTLPATPVGP